MFKYTFCSGKKTCVNNSKNCEILRISFFGLGLDVIWRSSTSVCKTQRVIEAEYTFEGKSELKSGLQLKYFLVVFSFLLAVSCLIRLLSMDKSKGKQPEVDTFALLMIDQIK